MKIILDTNVLISGIFFKGPPFEIIRSLKSQKNTLIVTSDILKEYQRVISDLEKKFPHITNATKTLETILINAHFSYSIILKEQVCLDSSC